MARLSERPDQVEDVLGKVDKVCMGLNLVLGEVLVVGSEHRVDSSGDLSSVEVEEVAYLAHKSDQMRHDTLVVHLSTQLVSTVNGEVPQCS